MKKHTSLDTIRTGQRINEAIRNSGYKIAGHTESIKFRMSTEHIQVAKG